DDEFLVKQLVLLTRRLGHVPVQGDLLIARKNEPTFPSEKVFRRLGSKPQRVSRVISFCEANPGHEDVAALWRQVAITQYPPDTKDTVSSPAALGYVYLLKHGSRREY